MALKGSPQLRRRLKAIKTVFKPAGKDWAEATAVEARRRVQSSGAVDTGKTLRSIRKRNASMKKATVTGNFPVNFIDAGVKAHDITPKKMSILKFEAGSSTVFARKVHKRAIPARPFKKESGAAGLKKVDILSDLIELWNQAA